MSTHENEALAHRFHLDLFQQGGNLEVADEIIAPEFVIHSPGLPPEMQRGPAGVKAFARMVRTTYPDFQVTHDDTISADDRVVIRWTARGTHQGEFQGIPPTGKQVTVTLMNISRIGDGKIVEDWVTFDQLGMLQQLGVIPPPGQAGS